jgi:hypothetical protein
MEIVNESDMDVTWWCYRATGALEAAVRDVLNLPGGKGDLTPGGRASYNPGPGIVWVDVTFTKTDGGRTYAYNLPSNASTLAHRNRVNWNDTIIFRRGSGKWEAVRKGEGVQVG